MNTLDAHTLWALWQPAHPDDVRTTIEAGYWGGLTWPGHPEWHDGPLDADNLYAGSQLLALGIHWFTTRYPEASDLELCVAAQVLVSHAVSFVGGYPVEDGALYQQAEAVLLTFAGGQANMFDVGWHVTPPMSPEGVVLVPGGDRAAFTRAAVRVIEACVFVGESAAHALVGTYLTQVGGDLALRAAELYQRMLDGDEAPQGRSIVCEQCGIADLRLFWKGTTWGEELCNDCYQTRVQAGRARPQDA